MKANSRNFARKWTMVAALAAVCCSLVSAAQKRPNILFIFTDDHCEQAISAYGSKLIQTPGMDRIARTSKRAPAMIRASSSMVALRPMPLRDS